jgi:fructose-specific phosphotransferase system IIC component
MRSRQNFSAVPFVAAVLGSLAVVVLPVEKTAWLFGVVLLLDFTVPSAVLALAGGGLRRRPDPPK